MSLFVDTSIWYAAADRNDLDHRAAARIVESGERLITSDHVIIESSRLIAHRIGRSAEDSFLEGILQGAADVEIVRHADLHMAWEIGRDYPDQDFSIVDRTSFVVMRRLGVLRVATFDHHFAVYRFGQERRQAFTVIR